MSPAGCAPASSAKPLRRGRRRSGSRPSAGRADRSRARPRRNFQAFDGRTRRLFVRPFRGPHARPALAPVQRRLLRPHHPVADRAYSVRLASAQDLPARRAGLGAGLDLALAHGRRHAARIPRRRAHPARRAPRRRKAPVDARDLRARDHVRRPDLRAQARAALDPVLRLVHRQGGAGAGRPQRRRGGPVRHERARPPGRGAAGAARPDRNERARREAARGRQIVISPEGTRRAAGAPPAYKYGVAHLYQNLAVPCLPVALNTGLYWPRRSFLRRPGTAVIEFLDPIPPGLSRDAFFEEVKRRIETGCDRLVAEGRRELWGEAEDADEDEEEERAGGW